MELKLIVRSKSYLISYFFQSTDLYRAKEDIEGNEVSVDAPAGEGEEKNIYIKLLLLFF
jgi:hypothetical protein